MAGEEDEHGLAARWDARIAREFVEQLEEPREQQRVFLKIRLWGPRRLRYREIGVGHAASIARAAAPKMPPSPPRLLRSKRIGRRLCASDMRASSSRAGPRYGSP